jgi:hypothetical protein
MTRILIVLIVGLVFYHQMVHAKKVHGYYVTKSMDTMKVSFEIPTGSFSGKPKYERMQAGIEYYDDAGMVQVLLPTQLARLSQRVPFGATRANARV